MSSLFIELYLDEDVDVLVADLSFRVMPVDNQVYDQMADSWWDEEGFLSFMPPDFHDWTRFIKPEELVSLMAEHGLESRGQTGLKPAANPVRALRILHAPDPAAYTCNGWHSCATRSPCSSPPLSSSPRPPTRRPTGRVPAR